MEAWEIYEKDDVAIYPITCKDLQIKFKYMFLEANTVLYKKKGPNDKMQEA